MIALAFAGLILLMRKSYRRSDAAEESFLAALLVVVMTVFVPDCIVLLPVLLLGLHLLWADNLRVWLAILVGLLLPVVWGALGWLLLPDSVYAHFLQTQFFAAFSRHFCWPSPLPVLIVEALGLLFSLWMLLAHFAKFVRAEIRMRGLLSTCVPVWLLSLASILFPMQDGNCIASLPWLMGLLLAVQYVLSYGFPRIHFQRKRTMSRSSRRGYKRKKERLPGRTIAQGSRINLIRGLR